MTTPRLTRRTAFGGLGALALAAACRRGRGPAPAAPFTLTIGYQRSSWGFLYLKRQATLAPAWRRTARSSSGWSSPPAPRSSRGINVGSVDIALVGDAPPIFAQASGLRFAYAAVEPPKPEAAAVIVRPDAPLKTIAELRGKQVALQKGSSAHHMLIRGAARRGPRLDRYPPGLPGAAGRARRIREGARRRLGDSGIRTTRRRSSSSRPAG